MMKIVFLQRGLGGDWRVFTNANAEGPTPLRGCYLGIVLGAVEKDPQNQHVEELFLRTELKTWYREGLE